MPSRHLRPSPFAGNLFVRSTQFAITGISRLAMSCATSAASRDASDGVVCACTDKERSVSIRSLLVSTASRPLCKGIANQSCSVTVLASIPSLRSSLAFRPHLSEPPSVRSPDRAWQRGIPSKAPCLRHVQGRLFSARCPGPRPENGCEIPPF